MKQLVIEFSESQKLIRFIKDKDYYLYTNEESFMFYRHELPVIDFHRNEIGFFCLKAKHYFIRTSGKNRTDQQNIYTAHHINDFEFEILLEFLYED